MCNGRVTVLLAFRSGRAAVVGVSAKLLQFVQEPHVVQYSKQDRGHKDHDRRGADA